MNLLKNRMLHKLLVFVLVSFGCSAYSQSIIIKGRLIDDISHLPITAIINVSDSCFVNSDIKTGEFEIALKSKKELNNILISAYGKERFLEIKNIPINTDFIDFGDLYLFGKTYPLVLGGHCGTLNIFCHINNFLKGRKNKRLKRKEIKNTNQRLQLCYYSLDNNLYKYEYTNLKITLDLQRPHIKKEE